MVININPGGPAGGSGNQYFIGHFDGERFTPDDDSVFNGEAPVGSLIADFEESESESGWTATKDLQGLICLKATAPGGLALASIWESSSSIPSLMVMPASAA